MSKSKGPNRCSSVGADAFLTLERRGGSPVECVISMEDAELAAQYRLGAGSTGSGKMYVQAHRIGGPKKPEMFARVLLGATETQSVRYLNGDRLDLRRSNLMLMDSKAGYARGPNAQRIADSRVFILLQRQDGSPCDEAIFDASKAEELLGWRMSFSQGYANAYRLGAFTEGMVRAHWLVTGRPPPGMEVDHINGNRLDNRAENLRLCTRAQNGTNKGAQSNNKIGVKGVHRARDAADGTPRFTVAVGANGTTHYKGGFRTIEAAAEYASALRSRLHGEFCRHK